MEFRVEQRKHPNLPKYPTEDLDLARRFAVEIQKELKDFLKTMVMFGSTARNLHVREAKQSMYERDIDVLMILNDLTMIATDEVIQAYRIIVEKTAGRVSKRLHINTLKLTTFWDYVRVGDPIVYNMLRDGIPLYDTGFFEPLQYLLFQGRIRPTKEAMWTYYARAPSTLLNADWHVLQGTLDLYWAVIDSAHAALIKVGEIPPTPEHVADLIHAKLVKPGIVAKRYGEIMRTFYELSKKITHREVVRISGEEYEHYLKLAKEFVAQMKRVIEGRQG